MAQIIGLPKLSPTMEEGVLVKWTKKEGDRVSPGDLVAEVETDKANMDFNIEDEGVLLKFLVKEGDTVKLGAPVAIIGKAGEDVAPLLAQAQAGAAKLAPASKAAAPAPAAPTVSAASVVAATVVAPPMVSPGQLAQAALTDERTRNQTMADSPSALRTSGYAAAGTIPPNRSFTASPLAKSLAIELGVDLRTIKGTGPGGRIVERDVRMSIPPPMSPAPATLTTPSVGETPSGDTTALTVRAPAEPPALAQGDYTDVPASNMRKRIASRLTEAKRDVPHFYLQRQVDAAPLLGFRQRLNELLGDRGKVSVNDLVIKAVALALRRVPECNASWEGEAIRRHHRVHVGVAVAIEDGLVTPVVRDADQKGIGAIAAEVRDLAERAKARQLKGPEITGSTFTVSNLGMFGVERFTAIINPPEAGILAVGGVIDMPVVKDGAVVPGKRMTLSMSCDHRVIDGALGARWLAALVDLLEHPESLAL